MDLWVGYALNHYGSICPKSLWIVFNWLRQLKVRIESLCHENHISTILCVSYPTSQRNSPQDGICLESLLTVTLFEFVELCTQMNPLESRVCSQWHESLAGNFRGPLILKDIHLFGISLW